MVHLKVGTQFAFQGQGSETGFLEQFLVLRLHVAYDDDSKADENALPDVCRMHKRPPDIKHISVAERLHDDPEESARQALLLQIMH